MFKCRVCFGNVESIHTLYDQPSGAYVLHETRKEALAAKADLGICQCTGCGLIQLSTSPVPYYKTPMRSSGVSESLKSRQLKALSSFIGMFNLQTKNIIEVGGNEHVALLRELNANATSEEVYPEDIETCKEADAFICINFLEHSPNPNSFLQGLLKLVKVGGFGMISVPDFYEELVDSSMSIFIRDHILYFTNESLRSALAINGFEVLNVFRNSKLNVLTAYVMKRRPFSINSANNFYKKLLDSLYDYVTTCGRIAVWGASHHAFSILSNRKISKHVAYIIDSSSKKQGKFSPVSGIEIYPPERLTEDHVDGILIMSPEYSEEIANIIKEKYDVKTIVTILEGELKWLK